MEIKELDTLLAPILGEDKEMTSYDAYSLIGPGENYGSLMLGVDVNVKNLSGEEEGEEEQLHLVAKMCPPTEFIMKMFNIPVTFKKEIGFYNTIIPTLQEFQKEKGCEEVIDFVPKYFGSRISLLPDSDEVDDDACLLLENLKVKGYDIGDRIHGFDLESAEYLIKDLAMFHAVPIALKLTDPERFEEKIQPNLVKHVTEETMSTEMCDTAIATILECAKRNEGLHQYLDRMEERLLVNTKCYKDLSPEGREPFATMVHNDFWVNNTMLRYEDGKPVANAIVDFQLITYGNPASDLLFFIYSSLSNKIITENYHGLVDLYYDTFIGVLGDLDVDIGEFTYEGFLTELDLAAKEREFFHIIMMLKPICAEKDQVKDLSEVNEESMFETDSLSELYFERLAFVVQDFAEKGWI